MSLPERWLPQGPPERAGWPPEVWEVLEAMSEALTAVAGRVAILEEHLLELGLIVPAWTPPWRDPPPPGNGEVEVEVEVES